MKTRIITAIIGITIGIIVMILSNTVLYPIVVAAIAGMSVYEILHACGCGVNKYPGRYHCLHGLILSAISGDCLQLLLSCS